MTSPELPPQPNPEKAREITMPVEVQRAVLPSLLQSLTADTLNEMRKGPSPEEVARVAKVRQFTTEVVSNLTRLGDEINPFYLLNAGITTGYPEGFVESRATIGDPYAKYVLEQKQETQKPPETP